MQTINIYIEQTANYNTTQRTDNLIEHNITDEHHYAT